MTKHDAVRFRIKPYKSGVGYLRYADRQAALVASGLVSPTDNVGDDVQPGDGSTRQAPEAPNAKIFQRAKGVAAASPPQREIRPSQPAAGSSPVANSEPVPSVAPVAAEAESQATQRREPVVPFRPEWLLPPPDHHATCNDRAWVAAAPLSHAQAAGSVSAASHRGPEFAAADKENEDFAFAGTYGDWLIAGVCDGVGQSAWQDWASALAGRAFFDAAVHLIDGCPNLDADLAASPSSPERAEESRALVVDAVYTHLSTRLQSTLRHLEEEGRTPDGWSERVYRKTYLGPDSAPRREREWLQSTMLGVALGPQAGFAILLGDGALRMGRGASLSALKRATLILDDQRGPDVRVMPNLPEEWVQQSFRAIVPNEQDWVEVALCSDGVSKSPDHQFDVAPLASSDDAMRYLNQLAARPLGAVEADNMSVACASRRWRHA